MVRPALVVERLIASSYWVGATNRGVERPRRSQDQTRRAGTRDRSEVTDDRSAWTRRTTPVGSLNGLDR